MDTEMLAPRSGITMELIPLRDSWRENAAICWTAARNSRNVTGI